MRIPSENKTSRFTPGGTRTHNLWIRSPTPYPLGHRGWWFEWSASPTKSVILKQHGITIPLFLYEEMNKPFVKQKIWNASRICVSSLRRGHANLLCIVPILVYVFRRIHLQDPYQSLIYPCITGFLKNLQFALLHGPSFNAQIQDSYLFSSTPHKSYI